MVGQYVKAPVVQVLYQQPTVPHVFMAQPQPQQVRVPAPAGTAVPAVPQYVQFVPAHKPQPVQQPAYQFVAPMQPAPQPHQQQYVQLVQAPAAAPAAAPMRAPPGYQVVYMPSQQAAPTALQYTQANPAAVPAQQVILVPAPAKQQAPAPKPQTPTRTAVPQATPTKKHPQALIVQHDKKQPATTRPTPQAKPVRRASEELVSCASDEGSSASREIDVRSAGSDGKWKNVQPAAQNKPQAPAVDIGKVFSAFCSDGEQLSFLTHHKRSDDASPPLDWGFGVDDGFGYPSAKLPDNLFSE